jgi:hypothetical protein
LLIEDMHELHVASSQGEGLGAGGEFLPAEQEKGRDDIALAEKSMASLLTLPTTALVIYIIVFVIITLVRGYFASVRDRRLTLPPAMDNDTTALISIAAPTIPRRAAKAARTIRR